MMWGRWNQNGVWRAKASRRRLIIRPTHLYVAVGHRRLRLMNPFRDTADLKW